MSRYAGWDTFTGLPAHRVDAATTKARSKFNNEFTEVDGITFHSGKEANRYHELKMLEKAGEVRNMLRQHKVRLCVEPQCDGDEAICIGHYVVDFIYEERRRVMTDDVIGFEWHPVWEDVKGFLTPLYKWKKKHVKAQYGIEIRET